MQRRKRETRSRVFLVHGRNVGRREEVCRFLEQLGFDVVMLQERATGGLLIMEKLEQLADADCSVVLMTGDDRGRFAKEKRLRFRSRQNVILELGYFLAKFGRERVFVLFEEGVELPSDLAGFIPIALDERGAWRWLLAQELRNAGMEIDLNNTIL